MAILVQVRELGQGGWGVALLRSPPPQAEFPESRLPHVAFAPLAAVLVAQRYQWKGSTVRARQEGNRNPAG